MTWVLSPFQGTAQEVETDLQTTIQNQREEQIIPVVKKCISDMVEALGGYISVSANGHFNPASGEPGDVIEIHIASLPVPNAPTPPPVETPPAVEAPPVLTSQEAVAQNQPELRPEGSVAPPTGSEAPGNAGGLPGLETAPAQPAPVEETPVVSTGSGEGINDPAPVVSPADPAPINPENPLANQIGGEGPLPQNPPATDTQENVAQNPTQPADGSQEFTSNPSDVVIPVEGAPTAPAESAPVNTSVDTSQVFPDVPQSTQLDEQGNPITPAQ